MMEFEGENRRHAAWSLGLHRRVHKWLKAVMTVALTGCQDQALAW